jgi:MoxR-like ATPase
MPTESGAGIEHAKWFRPNRVEHREISAAVKAEYGANQRQGAIYVYHDDDIILAVNAALATGRPLLVSGPSGCGKSTLAFNVALALGRRYYEYTVTSTSEARDIIYQFDAVRRLSDASGGKGIKLSQAYLEPGPLWWALDPSSARQRGRSDVLEPYDLAFDPSPLEGDDAVILIDEIDKAEPDFPNNLLAPIGSLAFTVAPTSFRVSSGLAPLILITNNAERELPVPFLRRCVALNLPEMTQEKLVEIAMAQIPVDKHKIDLFQKIAEHVMRLTLDKTIDNARGRLSTAEYLDTVRACLELEIDTDGETFQRLSRITLRKPVSATSEAL